MLIYSNTNSQYFYGAEQRKSFLLELRTPVSQSNKSSGLGGHDMLPLGNVLKTDLKIVALEMISVCVLC